MDEITKRDYAVYLKACIEITSGVTENVTDDQIEQLRDKLIFCLAANAANGGSPLLTAKELGSALERYSAGL